MDHPTFHLTQPLVRRKGIESCVRALEIVEVLPLLELGGEQRSVIYDHTLGQSVEVFVVDSMGAYDFAVEQGRRRLYVEVADPPIEHVPVKAGLEFGPDVGLIY